MLRLIGLVTLQSVLLVAAQSLLKVSVEIFGKFSWSWQYFKLVLTTWQFAASGICAVSALLVWMHTLRNYDFSLAYPLLPITYVVGMISAVLFFHESIPATRWIGVGIIMLGVYFIGISAK